LTGFTLVTLVLIHLILQSKPIILTGQDPPVHLMQGCNHGKSQVTWIVRQTELGPPDLWRMSEALTKVCIPGSAQYVIPHPDEDTLFIVELDRILKWQFTDNEKKEVILLNQAIPIENLPSWIPGFYFGSSLYLPTQGKMVVYDLNDSLRQFKYQHNIASDQTNETNCSFPQPIQLAGQVYWSDKQNVYSLSPEWHQIPYPTLGVMERAIPVFSKQPINWFVFGGQRGDLDSFGWRLLDQEVAGTGILTRFAQDPTGDRFFFTTISNRVSSHLYASIMGKKYFILHVFEKKSGQWVRVQKKEFSLKKGTGQFGIYWPGDWDGDGLIDMVISDKRHGLRVFPAIKGRGFSEEPRSLGDPPQKLFSFGNSFAWSERKGSTWVIHFSDGGPE